MPSSSILICLCGSYNPTLSSSRTPPGNDIATIQSISGGTVTGRFAGETCRLKATNSDSWGYNASSAFLACPFLIEPTHSCSRTDEYLRDERSIPSQSERSSGLRSRCAAYFASERLSDSIIPTVRQNFRSIIKSTLSRIESTLPPPSAVSS